ncbi:MAG: hypothetical protein CMN57_13765 [Gammaproteobacteria bacterium]|nr:hypothetical protein [Gammaproteobacteria bacterium]
MDINGSSSSVIESVMRTAAPETASAVKTLNKANELPQQNARQPVEPAPQPAAPERPAPDPEARVGRNLDVRA